MIVTTITCDRCKGVFENAKMRTANIVMKEGARTSYISSSGNYVCRAADWCETCCEEMHLKPAPKTAPVTPEPTFEDLIRAIAQDEVQAAIGG